eukprot:478140-Pleurochrysis_carterae.AAC.2
MAKAGTMRPNVRGVAACDNLPCGRVLDSENELRVDRVDVQQLSRRGNGRLIRMGLALPAQVVVDETGAPAFVPSCTRARS